MRRWLSLSSLSMALALGLTGCMVMPPELKGTNYAQASSEGDMAGTLVGTQVRWGGILAGVTPRAQDTCFEIVGRPLDSTGEPRYSEPTLGRFMACGPGYYEPADTPIGRGITVLGTVSGTTDRRLGQALLREPTVSVTTVHIWPPEMRTVVVNDPYWGPGPGPWGPAGYWGGGGWGWRGWGPGPYYDGPSSFQVPVRRVPPPPTRPAGAPIPPSPPMAMPMPAPVPEPDSTPPSN